MAKVRVTIVIDKELNEAFRAAVAKKYGYHHGALSKALEEAIILWVKMQKVCETCNNPNPNCPICPKAKI